MRICDLLWGLGHPVATWTVVEVDWFTCSVGAALRGRPIAPAARFEADFASSLGRLLADLHNLDVVGFGPLRDDGSRLRGTTGDVHGGIIERWHLVRIWPFDNPDLSTQDDPFPPQRVRRLLNDLAMSTGRAQTVASGRTPAESPGPIA